MAILTQKNVINMEWIPFLKELKKKLFEVYGKEPLPYAWSTQDINEGSRKIIIKFFKA